MIVYYQVNCMFLTPPEVLSPPLAVIGEEKRSININYLLVILDWQCRCTTTNKPIFSDKE